MALTRDRSTGRLTERDLSLAALCGRVSFISVELVMRRSGMGRSQAYRRLSVLTAAGLLVRHRPFAQRPTVWAVPGRQVVTATFNHEMLVAALLVGLELKGRTALTDREVRDLLRRDPAQANLEGSPDRRSLLDCGRVPDVVELAPSGPIAYEIEIQSKGARRRRSILGSFAGSNYSP